MFNKLFQKNEKKSNFRLHVCKGHGYKPFKNLDFNGYGVYKTSNHTFFAIQDQLALFEKLSLINGSFTLCVVPSVFEPSKMLERIKERSQGDVRIHSEYAARYQSLIVEMVPDGWLPRNDTYMVINKVDYPDVKKGLTKLGFTLREIEPEKAIKIAVTYP